jgi:hypothetical protein
MKVNIVLKNNHFTIAGIIITVFASIGFAWAGMQYIKLYEEFGPKALIKPDEIKAFKNMKRIAQAQEEYIQKDWDRDGKKTYAHFFVHLWRSVDVKGKPVSVGLIPKRLGFAMEPSSAVNGYYYMDIHESLGEDENTLKPIDYQKGWAIVAMPADYTDKDLWVFIADSGRIFAKEIRHCYGWMPTQFPLDPISEGWKEINSVKDVKEKKRYPK